MKSVLVSLIFAASCVKPIEGVQQQPAIIPSVVLVRVADRGNLISRLAPSAEIALRFQNLATVAAVRTDAVNTTRVTTASGSALGGVGINPMISDERGEGFVVTLPQELPGDWLKLSFDAPGLQAKLSNQAALFWNGDTATVWFKTSSEPLLRSARLCSVVDDALVLTLNFSEPVRYEGSSASDLISVTVNDTAVECRIVASSTSMDPGPELSAWQGSLSVGCVTAAKLPKVRFSLRSIVSPEGVPLRRTQDREATAAIDFAAASSTENGGCVDWFEPLEPI